MKLTRSCLIGLVLVLQLVTLGSLIWRYERVVAYGTEVRAACKAFDPYDPLRGRYLQVYAPLTCTNLISIAKHDYGAYQPQEAFIRLEPSTNGLWAATTIANQPTSDGLWIRRLCSVSYLLSYNERQDGEKYEDFSKRREASGLKATVDLPSVLFVNEKLAPKAEVRLNAAAREGRAVAVYRVYDSEIVITDLEIDGKSISAFGSAL